MNVPHCLPILHPSLNTSRVLQNTPWPAFANYSSSGDSHITNVTLVSKLVSRSIVLPPFFPGIKDKLRSNQRNSVIREYRETIPQIHLVGSLVIRNLPFACVEINFQWEKTAGRNLVLRGGEEIRSNGVTDVYYNSIEKNILFFSFLAFKYEIRIHLICYGVSEEIRQWMI